MEKNLLTRPYKKKSIENMKFSKFHYFDNSITRLNTLLISVSN